MKTNGVPAIIMLAAGFIDCVIAILTHMSLWNFTRQLLLVLVLFYVIGCVVKMMTETSRIWKMTRTGKKRKSLKRSRKRKALRNRKILNRPKMHRSSRRSSRRFRRNNKQSN